MADAAGNTAGTAFPGQATGVTSAPAVGPENTAAFLDQLAEDAARAALPLGEEAVNETPRDAQGRFTAVPKPEDSTDDAAQTEEDAVTAALGTGDAPATEGATDTATDGDATETPEGETTDGEGTAKAAPALPMLDREPITKFTVTLGDQPVEGVPDLSVTFTANGKERTEPLDKVVRLAADGIYSEAREQRYRTIEAEATTAKQTLAQLEAAYNDAQAFVDALLADEGRYLAEKDAWDRQHTPEARAQRLEAQLQAERQQRELDAIATQGEVYFTQTLTPAIDTITQAVPMVSAEEIVARVGLYVQQLQAGRGYLLPSQYEAVSRYLLDDVVPWAKQVHAARAERFTPKDAVAKVVTDATNAKAEAEKATAKAQATKNKVAAAIKPVGKAAAPAQRNRPAPVTVDEAMDAATEDAVRSVLAMGA